MPRPSKQARANKRKSRGIAAKRERLRRATNRWEGFHEDLELYSDGVINSSGNSRSFEECKMIVLALKSALSTALAYWEHTDITWTALEKRVAEDFHWKRLHITEIRKQFLESEGTEVVVVEPEDGAASGKGKTSPANHNNQKLYPEHLTFIVDYVDECHRRGASVTLRKLRNKLRDTFDIEISKQQVGYNLKRLGLSYQPVKKRRRNHNAYRPERIREYIVGKDEVMKAQARGEKIIFVYTDESYVHKNHSRESSYFPDGGGDVNRGSGKGRRLIILHAITEDGPLAEIDPSTGKPALGKLRWNGDTPHPIKGDLLTCETVWSAESHTGDYHDNMDSDKFMLWLEERLLPTFDKVYGVRGYKMCLVLDNAPYHHKREVGSLQNLSKKKLLEMMEADQVDRIELPMTEARLNLIEEAGDEEKTDLHDCGEYLELNFSVEEQAVTASKKKPRVGKGDELKRAYVKWLKANKPEKLACKVERLLEQRGHKILWTPPYCPKLQPIEVFWAGGKNHVANFYDVDTTMRDVVRRLQDGWYGNEHRLKKGDNEFTRGTTCKKLVALALRCAHAEYLPLCSGLEGTIGALKIDPAHVPDRTEAPIDSYLEMVALDDDGEVGEA